MATRKRATKAPPTPDVTVENCGSLFIFRLHTPAAHAFVKENVHIESYMWQGPNAFACEHRFAADLAAGMHGDGLTVA